MQSREETRWYGVGCLPDGQTPTDVTIRQRSGQYTVVGNPRWYLLNSAVSALVVPVWRVNLYQAWPELGLFFFTHPPR
jgi:hypothetical protein